MEFGTLFIRILQLLCLLPLISMSESVDLYDPTSVPIELVEKKLLVTEVDILDILDYHNETFSDLAEERRLGKNMVLGYVTPWNNKGYDRAVKFAKKFTHISPVWLQIVPGSKDPSEYVVKGTHDIDNGWVDRLRASNDELKIVPRVLLEGFDGSHFYALIYDADKAYSFATAISKILKKHQLDGAVLEIWKPVKEDVDRRAMRSTIKTISDKLKKDGFVTVLVVPPSGGQNIPGRLRNEDFNTLTESTAAFSVMTYDHPLTYSSGGPISPLKWVSDSIQSIAPDKEKIKRRKLLLGLNHYGYDFAKTTGAAAIVGTTYLELLQKYHPDMEWDQTGREHMFKYRENNVDHLVHFPTLKSLDERINLAIKLGTGVAIWDLGQGLEYFFDLL